MKPVKLMLKELSKASGCLAFSITVYGVKIMRPQKALSVIRKAISSSLKTKEVDVFRKGKVKTALIKLHKKQFNLDKGYELYKYQKGFEPSYNELVYISDRFNAYHRLEWLLGVANDKFDYFIED
jgi:hypothetical protein